MDELARIANDLRPMGIKSSAAAIGLKRLRQRAGYSTRELADLIDVPASSYASYENKYKKQYLPLELVNKIAPHFERNGVDPEELYMLAGVADSVAKVRSVPAKVSAGREGARSMADIEELDVSAGAGAGTDVAKAKVVRTWAVPADLASVASEAAIERIKIIRVKGDSMMPTFLPIDRVMVDTEDRSPTPPGVFVVWDGEGFVIKRIQVIAHSDPVRVKFTSDNPKYDPYERIVDEAYIQGRVLGKWLWT